MTLYQGHLRSLAVCGEVVEAVEVFTPMDSIMGKKECVLPM